MCFVYQSFVATFRAIYNGNLEKMLENKIKDQIKNFPLTKVNTIAKNNKLAR